MKIEQDFEVYLSTWMQLAEERLDAIEEKLGVSGDFGRKKTGEDNHYYHQLMLARMKINSLEKELAERREQVDELMQKVDEQKVELNKLQRVGQMAPDGPPYKSRGTM